MFFDCHCHTERSACAEDVSLAMYAQLARTASHPFVVTDHSAHLFYPPDNKWAFWGDGAEALYEECHVEGLARCRQYVADLRSAQTGAMFVGVELDVLPDGRIVFDPELLGELDFVIGAVHGVRALTKELPLAALIEEFKSRTLRLCELRVQALSHPFREWRMKGREVPPEIIAWLVATAADAGVALELNGHYQVPECDLPMVRLCAEAGVPIAIGTDTHRSSEFGDFSYHQRILAEAGLGSGDGLVLGPEACAR